MYSRKYRFLFMITVVIMIVWTIFRLKLILEDWFGSTQPEYNKPDRHNGITNYQNLKAEDYDFLYGEELEKALEIASQKPRKNVLFWHPEGDTSMTLKTTLGRNCGMCEIVNDLAKIEDENTAAVIFLSSDITSKIMPKKRNPKQYWVWKTGEAPPSMMKSGQLREADRYEFNLTMTYRENSDLKIRYDYFDARKFRDPSEILAEKKSLALVVVSNCDYLPMAKVRMKLIEKLRTAGLKLTTSGKCFPNGKQIPRDNDNQLFQLVSEHKFYLAFENSYHCKNYITEKFYRALQAGAVPVVWGARKEDYARIIPESGFIFVEDFPTLESLVGRLHFLDRNDAAYLNYFKWRQIKSWYYREETFICQICRYVHGIRVDDAYSTPYRKISKDPKSYFTKEGEKKSVKSIEKFWIGSDNPECLQEYLNINSSGKIVL